MSEQVGLSMRFKRLEQNVVGRDFAVGDIHGSYDLVLEAMREVRFDPRADRLLCCGDLIDRGKGSERVVKFLSQPYVHSIIGNHEAMLLSLYEKEEPPLLVLQWAARQNGLEWWLDLSAPARQGVLEAIKQLPVAMEVETERGTVGFVHADVPSGMSWPEFVEQIERGDEAVEEIALWGRSRIHAGDDSGVTGVGRVFVGHTPQWGGMRRYGNVYAIDTGAVFGEMGVKREGCLTVANIVANTACLSAPKAVGLVDLHDADCVPQAPFGAYAVPAPARR